MTSYFTNIVHFIRGYSPPSDQDEIIEPINPIKYEEECTAENSKHICHINQFGLAHLQAAMIQYAEEKNIELSDFTLLNIIENGGIQRWLSKTKLHFSKPEIMFTKSNIRVIHHRQLRITFHELPIVFCKFAKFYNTPVHRVDLADIAITSLGINGWLNTLNNYGI